MTKLLKRDIGKTFKVTWLDPASEIRVELKDFVKKGLVKVESLGKLVYVSKDMVVLEHERCEELGDYTKIHPKLIYQISGRC